MNKKCFCDTNVLLEIAKLVSCPTEIFSSIDKLIICNYVLEELDKLKISSDENTKYQARQAGKLLEEYEDKIEYVVDENSFDLPECFDRSNMDNRIISIFKSLWEEDNSIICLSNDLLFRRKCKMLGLPCEKFEGKSINLDYKGYRIITLSEEEQAEHYQNPQNIWNLLENEYLLIKNPEGEIIDRQRWTNNKGFVPLNTKALKSIYFSDIKPKDVFQMMAFDSLYNTNFTLLFGKAGTAKTLLSLGWIMQNIYNTKINKCVVIFNSVPLKNNQSQGFYPGDRNQKILQSGLGGILSSKFGDMSVVEGLVNQGKLLLVPSCDIRGIEVSENDCLYVTEAQNTDIYTMKTIIQRAKCKLIIEGDMLEQQDLRHSNPKDNGMLRAIEVFKGSEYFSCVKLKNIYRHHMAEIADKM